MAFPTSPTEGQIYNGYIYKTNKWNTLGVSSTNPGSVTLEDDTRINVDLKGNWPLLSQRIRTKQTGNIAQVFPILRQFNDPSNWSSSACMIEIFGCFPTHTNMDYGMVCPRWGHGGIDVLVKVASQYSIYWGDAVLVSGAYYYRDLLISLGTYQGVILKIHITGNEKYDSTPVAGSGLFYVYG